MTNKLNYSLCSTIWKWAINAFVLLSLQSLLSSQGQLSVWWTHEATLGTAVVLEIHDSPSKKSFQLIEALSSLADLIIFPLIGSSLVMFLLWFSPFFSVAFTLERNFSFPTFIACCFSPTANSEGKHFRWKWEAGESFRERKIEENWEKIKRKRVFEGWNESMRLHYSFSLKKKQNIYFKN